MAGSKVADIANPSGQREILPPAPALYSAVTKVVWRGSEEIFTGIPKGNCSLVRCRLLLHIAASLGEETVVMSTWRTWSRSKKVFCWSVRSEGLAPLSAKGLPP